MSVFYQKFDKEIVVKLSQEASDLEKRIAAAKVRLEAYKQEDKNRTLASLEANKNEHSADKNLTLLETFKQSDIKMHMAIHVIMGSICLGIVAMIIYGQLYGCSAGCGGG